MSLGDRLRALDDRVVGQAERAAGRTLLREVLAQRARVLAVALGVFTLVELVVGREPAATALLLGFGAGVGALTGRHLSSKQASDLEDLPVVDATVPVGPPVLSRPVLAFVAVLAAGLLTIVLIARSPTPVPALLLSLLLQAVLQRSGLLAAETEQERDALVGAGTGPVARTAPAAPVDDVSV